MKKVEQYIKEYTRNCSNEWYDDLAQGYEPWLTPDHARCVAQIAKEETIKEVCKWIKKNVYSYTWYDFKQYEIGVEICKLIEDLKKHLEDNL